MSAAIAADHQHGNQHSFPSGKETEVRSMRAHRRNHPHHKAQITRRILDADHPGKLARQALDRRHVDRAGEHGNVIQSDVDRRVASDLGKVCVHRFGSQLVVKRRNNGHRPCAHLRVGFTRGQRLPHIRFCRAGQNWNPAATLFRHHLDNPASLFCSEARELARRTIRIHAVHTAFNQPGNKAAKLRFIHTVALVQRHQKRRENPFQLLCFAHSHRRHPTFRSSGERA